jgi:hypothetical protein
MDKREQSAHTRAGVRTALSSTQRAGEPMPTATGQERRRAIVFVVDDDASVRDALDSLLRSAGWRVKAFATAAEFLQEP